MLNGLIPDVLYHLTLSIHHWWGFKELNTCSQWHSSQSGKWYYSWVTHAVMNIITVLLFNRSGFSVFTVDFLSFCSAIQCREQRICRDCSAFLSAHICYDVLRNARCGRHPCSPWTSRRYTVHFSTTHPCHAGRPALCNRYHLASWHKWQTSQLSLWLLLGELGALWAVTLSPSVISLRRDELWAFGCHDSP